MFLDRSTSSKQKEFFDLGHLTSLFKEFNNNLSSIAVKPFNGVDIDMLN